MAKAGSAILVLYSATAQGSARRDRFKQEEADGDITIRTQRADLPADREGRRGLPRPRGQALHRDPRRPERLRTRLVFAAQLLFPRHHRIRHLAHAGVPLGKHDFEGRLRTRTA
jgi:hypothetical protein